MKVKGVLRILGVVAILFLSGCATGRLVEPTPEELSAVSQFKKKVAVVDISDQGSQVRGIREIAISSLESSLSRQFDLIERRRIGEVFAERDLVSTENTQRIAELGRLLGADYLIFGSAACSFSEPRLKNIWSKDKKDRFYGTVWEEQDIESEVAIRIVDVSSGQVVFADKRDSSVTKKSDELKFDNRPAFDAILRGGYRGHGWRRIGHFSGLGKVDSSLVAQGLEEAIGDFRGSLTEIFPYKGEILQKISETKVLVNLGSAYGIKPGDKLAVYAPGSAIVDPKTGLSINQRTPAILLTVEEVSSGISCIARGRAADISALEIGTSVSTSRGSQN